MCSAWTRSILNAAASLSIGCGLSFGAWAAQDVDRAAWAEHRACVMSERTHRFLRHFVSADDARRERALAELQAARPAQSGTGWMPSLEVLRRVESLVADTAGSEHETTSTSELDALAGALDLIAVPGAFESSSEGLGDALTVQVRALYKTRISADFVLELHWRGRDGRDVQARREPIGASAVTAVGFPMYIRAPLAAAEPWYVYGLASRPDAGPLAGVLPEVRVDCVDDLRARSTAVLARRVPEQPGIERLQRALVRLLSVGQRTAASVGAGEMLTALETWTDRGPPAGLPVPIERIFVDGQGVEHWLWSFAPASEPTRSIALIGPSFEADDHTFAGVLGERWIDLAERTKSHLFCLHLPNDLREVPALLRRLEAWNDGLPMIVVTRGDVAARLEIGVRTDESLGLDGVVISHSAVGADLSRSFEGTPRLVVAPGAASLREVPLFSGVDGSSLSLINDPELPLHVERWLAAAGARKSGGTSK